MKLQGNISVEWLKRNREWFVSVLFSVAFITFCSLSTTPFFHFAFLDSEIFQNMGMALLRGKIPYIDLFDHKGCILFFINAAGIWINRIWGLWILQSVYLCANFYLWLSIIRIFSLRYSLSCFVCTIFFVLQSYFGDGNLTEEWSLLFIGLPIYWGARAISRHESLSIMQVFYIGLCVGIVAFIRINNVMLIFGYLFYLLWIEIRNKSYCYIGKAVSVFCLGVLIPSLMCVAFFYFSAGIEGVKEMWYGTFEFNMEYMTKYNSNIPLTFQFKILSYAPIVMMMILSFLCFKKEKMQIIPLLLSYSIGLFFVGQTLFRHYFLVFIPLIVVTWGIIGKMRHTNILRIIIILTFVGASLNPLRRYVEHFIEGGECRVSMRCEQFKQMLSKVPIEQRNGIWNYNGQEAIDAIVEADMVQCNRIIIPFHLNISEKLAKEEKNKIVNVQPLWVLINRKYVIKDSIDKIFIENNYTPVDSTCVEGIENVVLMHKVE